MDPEEKLRLLGSSATEDEDSEGTMSWHTPCGINPRKTTRPVSGIWPTRLPNGRVVRIMTVMMTNACSLNCTYCATRRDRNIRRASFSPEELARIFITAVRKKIAQGLFLTSGIPGNPTRAMDRILDCATILREKYLFRGYLHLKILPGCQPDQIARAAELGSRISLNLEGPTDTSLHFLAREKDFSGELLPQLLYAGEQAKKIRESRSGWCTVTTQFVVGVSGESDHDLLGSVAPLYRKNILHHAHYSPFVPVIETPLENHPPTHPLRGDRLYQADFLLRQYGFQIEELPFDPQGNLVLSLEPKMAWALSHPERFPVEVSRAAPEELVRVPGIGPLSAKRIVALRNRAHFRDLRDLDRLGVVTIRAAGFITIHGKKQVESQESHTSSLQLPLPFPLDGRDSFRPALCPDGVSPCAYR